MTRTLRDRKDVAYEAARFAKNRHPADIIEIVDLLDRHEGSSCLRMGGRVDA